MDEKSMKEIAKLLANKSKIFISTHKSPDGDAIGSSLALYLYLKKQGHEVYVSIPDDAPAFLHWMPGFQDLINYKRNKSEFEEKLGLCSVLFALDYNRFNRTGDELGDLLSNSVNSKIMIDHHQEPDQNMDFMVWDTAASSTAQLVYDFICYLHGKEEISKEIGDNLYTGIMTDTGSFRFKSCTSHTMRIVADLLDIGVDGNNIHQLVYDQNSIDRLRLMGYALEKIKMIDNCHTAYISLSRKELNSFNYKSGDTEGLVNKALSVVGVKVAALITEKEGLIRLSFRSSAQFSVNEFSKKYFNGGGHYHAAGGNYQGSIKDACILFEEMIKKHQDELESA